MPFSVRTDKEFAGPTLPELLPILEDIPDPVEARWSGSRQDFLAFEKCTARTLILVAPDNAVAERALWLLGGALELSKDDLEAAKQALVSRKEQTWRLRVDNLGHTRGTLLLTKVIGESLRGGKTPKAAASITSDCLFRRIDPADADVLMRLRTANPRLL